MYAYVHRIKDAIVKGNVKDNKHYLNVGLKVSRTTFSQEKRQRNNRCS